MKITTDHPTSSYNIPVILDDNGQVMDYAHGIKKIKDKMGMTYEQIAAEIGVSPRTVRSWVYDGRVPPRPVLFLLAKIVNEKNI